MVDGKDVKCVLFRGRSPDIDAVGNEVSIVFKQLEPLDCQGLASYLA